MSFKARLCAMLLLLLGGVSQAAEERVGVRLLSPGRKIIPLEYRQGDWWVSDIKAPDLVLTNRTEAPVELKYAAVTGLAAGEEVLRAAPSQVSLSTALARINGILNSKHQPLYVLQLAFGALSLPEGALAESRVLEPGQSAVLALSKFVYLHHVGSAKLDGLRVELLVKTAAGEEEAALLVPLSAHPARAGYRYPLDGPVHMANLSMNYAHHRAMCSQEFAMDVVAADVDKADSFTDMAARDEPDEAADYGIFGRPIRSMGDGVVTETGTKFPDEAMRDPKNFKDPAYFPKLSAELIPKIGVINTVGGNYVVVDHGNGEFAAYCHMMEGSIRVEPGAKVRKGDVLGRVGNTGNSDAPHLHFQLMDSKDFLTANGLPMMFDNVPPSAMSGYTKEANSLALTDDLYWDAQGK
ncbi:MAG TPA: hypothetical protein DCM05_14755 [Elusimicrobia bacterium]|nr:hypothetical protein [Elusimicrobiota bacterium]